MAIPTDLDDPRGPSQVVGSLRRGLEILDMFTAERRVISIGDIAIGLAVHKSSASRLAATLAASGYLAVAGGPGSYRLGARIAALGPLALLGHDLAALVSPHLADLVESCGETGHLAVLEGTAAKTLAVVDGWHTVRMHSWVGKASPAHCSSMGKALLAGLPDERVRALYADSGLDARTPRTATTVDELLEDLHAIRLRGYGLDDQELEPGLSCVAAPVFAPDGTVDASISVSGPSQRVTPERFDELQREVRAAAWRASVARGTTSVPAGWPAPPQQAASTG